MSFSMLRAALKKYPIITNSFFYGTLYVSAEFSQQTINRKIYKHPDLPYDFRQILNYGIIGGCCLCPILTLCAMQHKGESPDDYDPYMITRFGILGVTLYPTIYYYWYKWLDGRYVKKTAIVITKKLLLDQFVLSPPLIAVFFIGMSILERKPDIFEDCADKFVNSFRASCCFWLPAQTVNFLMVPPTFRVVYIATCAFVWVNILCIIKRQAKKLKMKESKS